MSAIASALNGFADGRRARDAEKERAAERELRREEIEAADRRAAEDRSAARARSFDTGGTDASAASGAAPAAIPTGERAAYIRAGLIQRGIPDYIADGFLMNFEDESGLVADVVEGADNVHGTRGRGLYQLTDTKPGVGRRSSYEAWARGRGDTLYDVDSQLDYLVEELHGSEAGAWNKIRATKDAGSAGAAIVTHFLRPAKEHRLARVARYTGAAMPETPPAAQPRRIETAPPAAVPPAAAPPAAAGAMPAMAGPAAPHGRSFSITPGAARPWAAYDQFVRPT